MGMNKIYIICTHSAGGRYLYDATTHAEQAHDTAERLAQAYTAEGYELTERQHVRDGFHDSAPDVTDVWHLRKQTGDWCNVELYATVDK